MMCVSCGNFHDSRSARSAPVSQPFGRLIMQGKDPIEASRMHADLRARLFPWLLAKANGRYERWIADRKRKLFGDLRGTVLEIGPGAGVNLQYFSTAVHWIGIDPNPFMHTHLRKEAEKRGMPVDLRAGVAEGTDLPGQSVDVVVGTLVLCSISDVQGALKEVQRVLKPGGRYLFIEHVAARRGTFLRRVQRLTRPFLQFFAEGCHPDRETWNLIENAGFHEVKMEHFRAPLPVLSPHISGIAIR